MERLLREYTQNQEMVRNIGSTYYQIVYPVQLRQHKKIGISTREIGSSKVRKARSTVCHSTFSSHSPPLCVIAKYLLPNKHNQWICKWFQRWICKLPFQQKSYRNKTFLPIWTFDSTSFNISIQKYIRHDNNQCSA